MIRRFVLLIATVCVAQTPPLGLDAYLPVPEENPLSAERVSLGKKLFSDPRLSRDGKLSCASCHEPEQQFTDRRPTAIGVFGRRGTRRVPTLLNRGYGRSFFWDGRIPTLEQQVLQPILNPLEMDMTIDEAAARAGIDPKMLSYALASYVRTIRCGDSAYDRYVAGDKNALTPVQLRGLELFRGKANCATCHMGPNLSDERFHNTGIGWRDGRASDAGRAKISGDPSETGAFKTPTLRNAAERAPYMHDGSLPTLEDVVEHYDKGGIANPSLDSEIQPLHLTAGEKTALTAFLRALTGRVVDGL